MKRVLTLTMHSAHNYGAVLQAFALQSYLIQRGYKNEIIDYRPDYISNEYKIIQLKQNNIPIHRSIVSSFISLPFRILKSYRFNKFINENLKLTNNTFKTYSQLQESNPKGDVYIVGSDQVWNSDITKGVDPAFFLDFVTFGKKVSYAASFGKEYVKNEEKNLIKKHLEVFDAISIREESGRGILENLGIKKSELVVDPVFLLNKGDYNKISKKPKIDKYLLIYTLENDPLVTPLARKVAEARNLKIVSIGSFINRYKSDYHIRAAGPEEFLGYFMNADYVITNSFHGTAFSIIFNKDFASIKLNNKRGTRIENLLEITDNKNRVVERKEDFGKILDSIPYHFKSIKIEEVVQSSKNFISENI
ncbi:polysaccharide pyruvyl transferase family protein [Ureibacillus sp. MALMAid1270]|uniref:polysaccharide pyruvyl transferase family protein n=1 Tax=Ureibacillus sp. MALMAid1270 TaxID=3411629 RepID=UPI003BA65CEF